MNININARTELDGVIDAVISEVLKYCGIKLTSSEFDVLYNNVINSEKVIEEVSHMTKFDSITTTKK